ncbi:BnaC04g03670D [Brassica napus]|uniref:E3 ubiquitin-protein ligase RMA n=1 Tax=Brassica napus TaxID=3708 RepID=A0A078FYF7_BRANA|nr:BnaC04g03670D [Brassica napus]
MSSSTSVQGEIMDLDLDLNQEPDSPPGLITEISPWLTELETAHERIEDRLRQLEAIVSRIRERAATVTTAAATPSPAPALIPPRDSTAGVIHERSRERLVENDDKTYLIAKALNMERTTSVPGGYFDCNICLEKAEDPILTCCGHLFCWGCFYQLPFIYLNIKECPVCDGEVTDTEVIPIYGNGEDDNDGSSKAKREECGLQALAEGHEFGLTNIVTTGGGGNNRAVRNRLRLLSSFPGLVVDSSEMPPPTSDDAAAAAAAFDVDSFVDTTTPSLRTNRRRSSRIAEISPSPSPAVRASIRSSSSPRDFAVAGFGFGSREVATSDSSSSRRRTEDVNNGPRTRSRRRLG